jgi:hypothetical protein
VEENGELAHTGVLHALPPLEDLAALGALAVALAENALHTLGVVWIYSVV